MIKQKGTQIGYVYSLPGRFLINSRVGFRAASQLNM